jgi:hypothetical protein
MLQEAGTAVIVLWRYDDESVRPLHLLGKISILDGLTRVIGRKRELGNVDEFRLEAGAPAQFSSDQRSRVGAHAALSCSAQDNGDE